MRFLTVNETIVQQNKTYSELSKLIFLGNSSKQMKYVCMQSYNVCITSHEGVLRNLLHKIELHFVQSFQLTIDTLTLRSLLKK